MSERKLKTKIIYSERFGSSKVDEALLQRMEKVTGKPVHHLLRRGLFFSHRYVSLVIAN